MHHFLGNEVSHYEVGEQAGHIEIFISVLYIYLCSCCQDHVLLQSNRLENSLLALGKPANSGKIYLAGYHWHDHDSTFDFAREIGRGIIRPNGEDLDILDASVVDP